jgi:hypothetical protein
MLRETIQQASCHPSFPLAAHRAGRARVADEKTLAAHTRGFTMSTRQQVAVSLL